jgi:hypothetical protein
VVFEFARTKSECEPAENAGADLAAFSAPTMPAPTRSSVHDIFSNINFVDTPPTSDNGRLPRPFVALTLPFSMHEMKDTARALVRIGYDGRVHKTFRGSQAQERFNHEVRVLQYLKERGCDFVPQLLEVFPDQQKIVTTNCGTRVDQLNSDRQREVFAELELFGVRHEDRELRNITYRVRDGRFCVIDFEFATILDGENGPISLKPTP